MPPPSAEKVTHTVVCAGNVVVEGGALGVALVVIKENGELSEGHTFSAKGPLRRLWCGAVYTIEGTPDFSTITTTSAHYQRNYADAGGAALERVAAWQARSEAAKIRIRAAREESKAKRRTAWTDLLEPIRTEWRKTDRTGRAAIEVAVLMALRHGKE